MKRLYISLLFVLISQHIYGHDKHTYYIPKEVSPISYTQNEYYSTQNGHEGGIALAIAQAQHQFDWGTHSWQGSVGVGSYGGNDAISFGVAKRFDRVLITGSFGRGGPDYGFGASVNWRF